MGFMIKGNILYNSDQFKKSIRAFRRVKTSINTLRYNQIIPGDLYIKPEEKKYKTACCYLAMGKELSAIFLLKKALKINDKYAPALLLLAKIYLAKNKKNEAVELLRTCLLVNSGWKNAIDLFNTIYTDGNDLII
jgi:tetratricopeptide (TPR) repeat protein